MFMAAGFAMLESGMVTSKSVSVICAKNIGLYAISGIMFWLVGYNLAYGIPEGGYIGNFIPWSDTSSLETGYSAGSDWFFQMVFCATTVSICSGAMAERIKLWPFFLFAAILSGVIYPIVMGWQWGGGWLAAIGFSDFAGSTSGMVDYVSKNKPKKVMLVTECSMSDNVEADNPEVEFVKPCNLCPYMKKINLEKILDRLENESNEIHIDKKISDAARKSVIRMTEIGR